MISRKLRNKALILIAFLISACTGNEIFSEFHSIHDAEWKRNDIAVFEAGITDTLNLYDVSVIVRNNNNYPFRNIWLFMEFETPDGSLRIDTIGADLADEYGKWYGKGLSLYSYSIPYESSIRFPRSGVYKYSIRQGMREDTLKGISDIGLKISKKAD